MLLHPAEEGSVQCRYLGSLGTVSDKLYQTSHSLRRSVTQHHKALLVGEYKAGLVKRGEQGSLGRVDHHALVSKIEHVRAL